MDAQLTCPYCSATDVTIVASEENKDAIIIRCQRCGKLSELDVENPNAGTTESA